MRRVIIESPYAGDVEKHVAYARAALKDCLRLGEAPIASHLLFTQPGVLDDGKPEDRALGIRAGLEWHSVADAMVFYMDYGMSRGMHGALRYATEAGAPVEFRYLYGQGNAP